MGYLYACVMRAKKACRVEGAPSDTHTTKNGEVIYLLNLVMEPLSRRREVSCYHHTPSVKKELAEQVNATVFAFPLIGLEVVTQMWSSDHDGYDTNDETGKFLCHLGHGNACNVRGTIDDMHVTRGGDKIPLMHAVIDSSSDSDPLKRRTRVLCAYHKGLAAVQCKFLNGDPMIVPMKAHLDWRARRESINQAKEAKIAEGLAQIDALLGYPENVDNNPNAQPETERTKKAKS